MHMDILRQLDRNAERWLLLIFYVMLVITMAIEVLRREIFSYSSIWGEEIVRYSFIYLAWIGAAAAVKERAHIRIDVIMQYVGRRAKALLYMFGDIVSDAFAGLVGGMGFACSANVGDEVAVFEPSHGSAPKYADLDPSIVNPIAMVLSAVMMLDWLGETDKAGRLETAIADVIAEGKVRTYDMGGDSSTLDMAHAIADRL